MIDPVARSIANAPVEDEEITPETAARLDDARASIERGEGIPHDEILRELGLTPSFMSEAKKSLIWDEAIERYRRDKFLDDVNAAYTALRNDPKAWKEEQAERTLWDKTLGDGQILLGL